MWLDKFLFCVNAVDLFDDKTLSLVIYSIQFGLHIIRALFWSKNALSAIKNKFPDGMSINRYKNNFFFHGFPIHVSRPNWFINVRRCYCCPVHCIILIFDLIKKKSWPRAMYSFHSPPPHPNLYIFINFFSYELKNELLFFFWEILLKWKVTAVYINDSSFI